LDLHLLSGAASSAHWRNERHFIAVVQGCRPVRILIIHCQRDGATKVLQLGSALLELREQLSHRSYITEVEYLPLTAGDFPQHSKIKNSHLHLSIRIT
jgi:hypothetical protein